MVLRNCRDIRIELDLDNLRRDAARISHLSFQTIDSLMIQLRNINERSINMVFDDVLKTEFSGRISSPDLILNMYFRELRSSQGSVTFNRVSIEATVKVLNLVNMAHLTVTSDSYFRRLEELEIRQSSVATKCHSQLDNNNFYTPDVECNKDSLFSNSIIR